jgi:hypothetical protein
LPSRGHKDDSCPDRGQAVQIDDMKRTAVLKQDRRRKAAQIEVRRMTAAQIEEGEDKCSATRTNDRRRAAG